MSKSTAKTNEKDNKKEVVSVLTLLEEDDEFEEFEGGRWEASASDPADEQLWKDDWDDEDNGEDDFISQLREQIVNTSTNSTK